MPPKYDRSANSLDRLRRQMQRLNFGSIIISSVGTGLVLDTTTGALNVNLRDTDPGLELAASGLGVLLNGTTPCLSNTGGLTVVVDTSFGLSRNASGIRVDLATDPGLEFSSGDLRVKLDGSSLTRGAGGLSVTTPATSGTYTPTVSNAVNLDSTPTASAFSWTRIGNTITVAGRVNVDPTVAATLTTFDLTIPAGANFASADNAFGVAGDDSLEGGVVAAVTGTQTVRVSFGAVNLAAHNKALVFQYIAQ